MRLFVGPPPVPRPRTLTNGLDSGSEWVDKIGQRTSKATDFYVTQGLIDALLAQDAAWKRAVP